MVDIIDKTYRQIFCYNKDIGHLFVPNLNARIMNEKGGYFVKTNSLGFRSNLEFKKKKDSKPRILFFGDSNTAADGVSNNERFSELLGEYFGAEVYNFGLSGSGTDQQYLIWKNYAQNMEADLIVLGVLVENIQRNKVAYRESINPFTKKSVLIPKPYFQINENKLNLTNYPVPRTNPSSSDIDPHMVQWTIPKDQEMIYKAVRLWRKSKITKPINDNFSPFLERFRSFLIKTAYQPYKDYDNPNSKGYFLMKEILSKFINLLHPIPVIILPIPTYHYYVDGAKPIYKKLFGSFHNPKKNIYVLDLLKEIKRLDYKKRQSLCFEEDKGHFCQFGHQVISNFLKKKISDLKILPVQKKNKNFITSHKPEKVPLYVLGISSFYHDSAASLIKDGEIVAAAQEERFSRIKNDRRFPISSINYCLEKANIQQQDLSAIVYYDNAYLTFERMLWSFAKTAPNSEEAWIRFMPSWIQYKLFLPRLIRKELKYNGKILHNLHHRSHFASAFFASPFKKAAILTVDGVGEWATASIGIGEGNKLRMIKEMNFPNSLGLFYSAFTQFTGFKVNSGEYKMMGLAPYGKSIYVDIILKKLICVKSDGSIKINQKYFSYLKGSVMTNEKFADLFGGPAREPESIITQREMDIACSVQKVTEKIILSMARYAKKITGAEYLCMSGGVALNCVANGHLYRENIFKDIWIQPAAGDAGSSLGCALDAYYTYFKKNRKLREDGKPLQLGSYWGPEWNKEEIRAFLETENAKYKSISDSNERNSLIASYLNSGKIIGYFSGRTEFGPRALGARSIIGDPRIAEMQTKINLKIKYRESFRPFAPAVLADQANQYFEGSKKTPYMMFVLPVLKNRRLTFNRENIEDMLKIIKQPRSDIPAVTHIDYSARVQTIERSDHKEFYDLIKAFQKLTGCSVVINTSFNIRGEPIVNTPMDAYRCFMNTEMDVLVLEHCLLLKKDQIKFDKEKWSNSNLNKDKPKISKNFFSKKLKKLYNKNFTSALRDTLENILQRKNELSCWTDSINFNNSDKIFNIPVELDNENPDPQKMIKPLIEYWHNNFFGKILEPTILRLLYLGKKYPLNKDTERTVSDKIYEMF
jgi:carbamoyltransferase